MKTKASLLPLILSLTCISGMAFAGAPADPVVTSVGSAVGNFHSVAEGQVYRGARPDAAGVKALAKAGIKTIIDLQGGDRILGIPVEGGESQRSIRKEEALAAANGIGFCSEPMSAINPDIDDQAVRIEEVLNIVADPRNQPVYFHCRHGSDRTGLIAALYRVLVQGCTPAQAHAEMMKYGHSKIWFWMDKYFQARVANDPATHLKTPGPDCPLN